MPVLLCFCLLPFSNHVKAYGRLSEIQSQPMLNVSKGAKIRNRYNQVPHLTQDTNGKVTNSQLDTTNESQEVSPFSAGDHKAHINRRAQRHSKHKMEKKHKRSTKEVLLWNGQYFTGGLEPVLRRTNLTLNSISLSILYLIQNAMSFDFLLTLRPCLQ